VQTFTPPLSALPVSSNTVENAPNAVVKASQVRAVSVT